MADVQMIEPGSEKCDVIPKSSNHHKPEGKWEAGLCECCSAGPAVWLTAYFCPCIQYGLNSEKINKGSCCYAGCSWFLLQYMCFVPLGCCIHGPFRGTIRSKESIEVDGCCSSDCYITTFCAPCALCQEAKQLQDL
jgi:Cys-rich protein (TIGR01571 family)